MASITRQANGRRMIQFSDSSGRRKTIRLGKVNQRTAEAVKIRIENLLASSITGHALDNETALWVAGLSDLMTDKLVAVGLVAKYRAARLQQFLDGYIENRSDTKPSTRVTYGHTRRNLLEFFGGSKLLREITPGDADDWRLSLVKQGLASNTVRRRSGIAKQFFNAALRKELISSNPFADLKCMIQANTQRMYFISRDEAQAVLDACPNAQWRMLFALSRYGGLRCPSEHLALRWSDVDWERNRITVRSPKTEHHPGGESRQIPIFPELLPDLLQLFEQAKPSAVHVITLGQDGSRNLRTQMMRIIKRAGLRPWPKLFQNLRSTRETELAEIYPLHVVCAWIGNSQIVAAKHYLQVTDEHFQRAVGNPDAMQNAMPQAAVSPSAPTHGRKTEHRKLATRKELQKEKTPCENTEPLEMGDIG